MTIIFAVYLFLMELLFNIAIELLYSPLNNCEELSELVCPACGSDIFIKNGSVHNGTPKHQCKSCGRQFVDIPTKATILSETKQLIDRLSRSKRPRIETIERVVSG
jgi:insertion element IS1 protein InsB